MEEKALRFVEMIENAERITVLTGAGMSTESGIPDFTILDIVRNNHDSSLPFSTDLPSICRRLNENREYLIPCSYRRLSKR